MSLRHYRPDDLPPSVKELREELAAAQKEHDARCHNCHVGFDPVRTSPRLLTLLLDVADAALEGISVGRKILP